MGKCEKDYQNDHVVECYGYGKQDLGCCPWCGDEPLGDVEERLEHVNVDCEERPKGAREVARPIVFIETVETEEEEEEKPKEVVKGGKGNKSK